MPRVINKTTPLFILALIFLALFSLRMVPAIDNTVEFMLDSAFHYRMTVEVIQKGDVPAIDRLSTYPEGKNIKAFLPTGMYHACSFFHKIINKVAPATPYRSILLFTSICGSLIFIPLYFLSYEIYRHKTTAFLTALLGGAIPAYLHRSLCYWYRYEAVGTPILFVSLLFFIKAFGAEDTKKSFLHSIISAAFLIISFSVWRLSILFLIAYVITLLYLWIKYRNNLKNRQKILFALFGMSLLLFWALPGFLSEKINPPYSSFLKSTFELMLHNIGIKRTLGEFTRLLYYNVELCRVNLPTMFGSGYLSLSGVFAVIYFLLYLKNRTPHIQKDILFTFLLFFLILAFMFLRIKVIFGPLVALTLGESMAFALKNKKKLLRNILLCSIALGLIKTGYDSYKLALTRYKYTKIGPALKQALSAINRLTPKDAVLLSYWSDGYPIQTYCNRATITDGLFESAEIVKRILKVSNLYYSDNEERLWEFCKKYGATHILVPTNRKRAWAVYAGLEYNKYFRNNKPTSEGKRTTLSKLIFTSHQVKYFHNIYKNNKFLLYKVK